MTHREFYDVIVVGAGAAGVAAAATAADGGAPAVALIDSSHRLGGAVTGAMHRSICGLYAARPRCAIETLNAGVQRAIIERMVRLGGDAVAPREFGKAWVLEFPPPVWEQALDEVSALPNLDRLMGCNVCQVDRNEGRIAGIRVAGALNREIGLRVLIDCTGGGIVVGMCGQEAALPTGDKMLGGYSIRVSGLDGNLEMLRIQVPYVLTRAVSDGKLPHEACFTMFQPGPGQNQGICKLAVSPDRMTKEDVELFATWVLEHLRAALPAFADVKVVETSPRAFSRDGMRLRGKYVVNQEDILSARRHTGDAVFAWWPIEFWDLKSGPVYEYPPPGEPYNIPASALQSEVIPNLLAAGTCISATSRAAASLRASGICLATGGAAGALAASMANRF